MVFVYPNTISTFSGDRDIAISSGYMEIEDQVYADLVETKLKWENNEIVEDPTYPERKAQEEEARRRKEAEDAIKAQIAVRKNWFDVKYRQYNEMLTRFAALGIAETITDDIRSKVYASLNDLYLEGEVVRAEIKALEAQL